ncbi:glycerophosphodiester phosphodiesterase [Serratia microhaemolytica]|uniref:glycerophosphodiester phosphodiesterase n=1 Tax=Serratia microhaemolytica TaxID=2675110 RepID=UPI000FDCFB85|nr:glycerophosphodiester phosphodiesterase [Serratia microhaemolytica]
MQTQRNILLAGIVVATSLFSAAQAADKLVIAHRGASGYLPEHTLPAKAMAFAMGADYLEQDVVMTKDDKLIVLHDHYLDRVTDVAQKFPHRHRRDGRYYALDFTLDEIKTLRFTEEFRIENGRQQQKFANRFPMWKSEFRIHTLQDEIEMIQGMNHSTGRDVGIYVETKAPWLHKLEGKDISKAVLEVLRDYGYTKKTDKVYFQSFDAPDLERVKKELLPAMNMNIKLIQLITNSDDQKVIETMVIHPDGSLTPYSYSWMLQPGAAAKLSEYVDGIGPWYPMVVQSSSPSGRVELTTLAKEAKRQGLQIHPYTFRADPGQLPSYARDFDEMLRIFYIEADVDGLFTDFPDKSVQFLQKNRLHR